MRSKNWFFNKTLFFKNCTRFWPLWAAYTLIWLFALPGTLFVNIADDWSRTSDYLFRFTHRDVIDCLGEFGLVLAVGFGFVAALAVFSYLFFPRAAGLMHTLPIRREGLFLTNYLSGLSFLWVPHLLTAILLVIVEAGVGALHIKNVLIWLAVMCAITFFFYTFAVLCAMLTGNVLAMPALYAIFNCVIFVIYLLINQIIDMFSYGHVESEAFSNFAMWCTPAGKLAETVGVEYIRDVEHNVVDYAFKGTGAVVTYAVIGAIFLLCALLLYRRRHIESAGDVIAVGWMKPIFKYSFAFCAALCGSWVFYYVFFRTLMPSDFLALLVPMVICGFLGCFFAEMFLQKSFKVFRKGWLASTIFTALVAAGLFGLSVDIFGFETQIPDLEDIKEVQVDFGSTPPHDEVNYFYDTFTLEEPQRLEAVHQIHQIIIDNRTQYELQSNHDIPFDGDFTAFDLTYVLKNGSTLKRHYSVPVQAASDTAPAASLEGRLLSLLRDPELMMEHYFDFDSYDYQRPANARLDVYNPNTNIMDILHIEDQATLDALYEAIRADIEAGRLGIRYLSDFDPARMNNCAANDLRLDMLFTGRDSIDGKEYTDTNQVNVTLQFTATETLRVLCEAGFFTETQTLIPYGEQYGGDLYTPEYWEKYEMYDMHAVPVPVEEFTGKIIYPETSATVEVIAGIDTN